LRNSGRSARLAASCGICELWAYLCPLARSAVLLRTPVVWQPARTSSILDILHNPAYAGAYVYGRKTLHPARRTPAHPRGGRVEQSIDKWEICLHNRYPAYIPWDEFGANQAHLRTNSLNYRKERAGVARKGQALLQGIVRCGRCGALLRLHYSGREARVSRLSV